MREGETGLLVAPGDSDGLAASMLRIADDPEAALAMGREGRRRAIERFPEDRCTERTEQVYDFWLDVRRADRFDATASNGSRESAAAASTASRKSQATR